MKIEINNDRVSFYPEKCFYSSEVIFKCFYWYSNYTVDITDFSSDLYRVTISDFDTISNESLVDKVKKDLIDFKLREIVSIETKNIRELLIAKAFAYYDVVEDPNTEISDPVGFNPQSF